MKKFFIIIGAMCMFTWAARGDDVVDEAAVVATPVVTERLTCDEISAQIAALSAVADPSQEEQRSLSTLRMQQRRNCTKAAGARRATGRGVATPLLATSPVVDDVVADADVEAAPELSPEEAAAAAAAEAQRIAELLEQGLCADGTKPNKFGCCTGEKFTDMGNLQFGCCPRDGGDCFPPMK